MSLLSVCQSVGQSDSLNHLYIIYKLLCFYLESPKAMILCLETSVMFGTSYLLVLSHACYSAHISLSLNHSDPQALNICYYLSWLIITIVCYFYCFALFIFFLLFEPSKFLLPIPQQSMIHMICSVFFCYFFRNPLPLWPGSIFDSLCNAAIQHLILRRPLWYIWYWCNHNNICYSIASMPVLLLSWCTHEFFNFFPWSKCCCLAWITYDG